MGNQSPEVSSGQLQISDYFRVPGLFRRWEFEDVLVPGRDYRIVEQGRDSGGTKLFALYQREPFDEDQELSGQSEAI
jgi:hypothetical protein